MAVKHWDIQVFGMVQGVSFRAHTQEQALRLGITGFVCNETDGSVYIEAEGTQENLTEFVSWCRQGPSMAQVSRVTTNESGNRGFYDFQITWHRM